MNNSPVKNTKIYTKAFATLNNKFKNLLGTDVEIKPKDIINLIISLMQIVEKNKINGSLKKELVISIIAEIINKNRNNIQNADSIENFVTKVLPSFIDVVISIDRKDIIIKLENALNFSCI
jgi:hypothetical protein